MTPEPQLHPQPEPQSTPQESQHQLQLQLHPGRLQKSRQTRNGTAIGGILTRKKERSRDDSKKDIGLREPDKDPDTEKNAGNEERVSLGSGPKKKHKKKRKKKVGYLSPRLKLVSITTIISP